MKFSIITPTHRRKELLERAVSSLFSQTYIDWEMIIVNDSPQDTSYDAFASSINDARIHYYKNDINKGVNYSRNYALDRLSADSQWVIFLDDDDYLAPDVLETFYNLIRTKGDANWFITNRAYRDGTPTTNFPKSDTWYSYAWDYLILKRCKGDATHCIKTKEITTIRFSKNVKQAEEWFFFYQFGLKNKFYYHNHNSTITNGYNTSSGLNFRKRTLREKYKILILLCYEASLKKIICFSFLIYILMRFVRIVIK